LLRAVVAAAAFAGRAGALGCGAASSGLLVDVVVGFEELGP
jgi:hypothetical protein